MTHLTSIWSRPVDLAALNEITKGTFSDHLKISFIDVTDDSLTAQMPIEGIHLQPMGRMHGGASAALAETVASAAAYYCVPCESKRCVGIELNINHLRAVQDGFLRAVAKPLHRGKTTQVWEIKIYHNNNSLISAARLTLSVN